MLKDFFQKYTNLIGTIAAVTSAITLWLVEQGCIAAADVLTSQCTISWLPTSLMPYISGFFIAALFVSKLTRPGGILRSLIGSTAVVVPSTSPNSTAGTVTPAQVAQP